VKNLVKSNWLSLIVIVLSFVFVALNYTSLPDLLPSHFNIDGAADRFASKESFFYTLPLISILLLLFSYIAVKYTPNSFPLDQSVRAISFINFGVIFFLMCLYIGIALSALYPEKVRINDFLSLGIVFLIILIGNYLGKIERNFLIGIRIPWTLASEENWNRTHRFSAKAFLACGLICGILYLLNLFSFKEIILFTVLTAVLCVVYSFVFFYKHERLSKN